MMDYMNEATSNICDDYGWHSCCVSIQFEKPDPTKPVKLVKASIWQRLWYKLRRLDRYVITEEKIVAAAEECREDMAEKIDTEFFKK